MIGKPWKLILLVCAVPVMAAANDCVEEGVDATDAAGVIVATVDAIAAPPACESIDLKQLVRRIRDTEALGFFSKLTLYGELQTLGAEVIEIKAAGRPPARVAQMREKLDELLNRVAERVRPSDPQLASDMECNRERAWQLLWEKDFEL